MKQLQKHTICVLMLLMTTAALLTPLSLAWPTLPFQDSFQDQEDEIYQPHQEKTSHFKRYLPIMVDLSRKVKIMLTILAVIMVYIIMRFLFYRFMIQQLDTRPQTALAIHYSIFLLLSFVCVVLMFSESFCYYMVYILGSAWLVLTVLAAALL